MMQKRWVPLPAVWMLLIVGQIEPRRAEDTPAAFQVDLPTAITRALQENPAVQATRHTLGLAKGRVEQAELVFQDNPRLSIEADYRNRRFRAPTGRATADAAVSFLQEIEIAGQRGHRRQAAATHLAYAKQVIADAERLLRLDVMRAFYELLAMQEKIRAQQDILKTREALLQAGRERFAQEDISVLELDTLQLDTDQARTRLLASEQERVVAEKELRLLLGPGIEQPLVAVGNLFGVSAPNSLPPQAELFACALEHRPDYQAARLQVETREAELRLAQANRIPNISLGPIYKLDNEDQVVGGALTIPLPLFNRNAHEITAATANVEIARQELEARMLAVRHEVAAAYAHLQLALQQDAVYGKTYPDKLTHSADFTQQAYEAGEISIFEFSVALERLTQARVQAVDSAFAALHARAQLQAQLAFRCFGPDDKEGWD